MKGDKIQITVIDSLLQFITLELMWTEISGVGRKNIVLELINDFLTRMIEHASTQWRLLQMQNVDSRGNCKIT